MHPHTRIGFLAFALAASGPAFAQDDDAFDDDLFGDDEDEAEDEEETVERVEDDTQLGAEGDPDDDEWVPEVEEEESEELNFEDDEFGEDADVKARGPGEDTARIYRDQLEEVEEMGPDEEALAWEKYLKKWPNSVFRTRIEARVDDLASDMYDERIDDNSIARVGDAGKAELQFGVPMILEPIDPRTKLRAGFEWGFPSYINFIADYERQLWREFSVHGGLRHRYSGWSLETGPRWALVKSARTGTLVTLLPDLHLNLDPMHVGFRPQVAFGKRFGGTTTFDVQVQGGTDLAFPKASDGTTATEVRYIGGGSLTVAPSATVKAFIETQFYMKDPGTSEIGLFRFNTVSFGIKFVNRKGKDTERLETGVGATAPYTANYWGYHFGSVAGDVNFFL